MRYTCQRDNERILEEEDPVYGHRMSPKKSIKKKCLLTFRGIVIHRIEARYIGRMETFKHIEKREPVKKKYGAHQNL